MNDGSGAAAPLFPVFLKLDGARALVVGGGPIGARKAADLLRCGARVVVVSPTFCDAFDALLDGGSAPAGCDVGTDAASSVAASSVPDASPSSPLLLVRRTFTATDLDSARIVFAATGVPSVDDAVVAAAAATGALVNVVDVPEKCDFYCGAIVARGPVQVAVSTGGASPVVAQTVRDLVDSALPAALGPLAERLGARRAEVLAALPSYAERAALLRRLVDEVLAGADVDECIDALVRQAAEVRP